MEEGEPVPPVAIDICVRQGTRAAIITGPNTGGKTATLKVGFAPPPHAIRSAFAFNELMPLKNTRPDVLISRRATWCILGSAIPEVADLNPQPGVCSRTA